jgi:hypothetical protein
MKFLRYVPGHKLKDQIRNELNTRIFNLNNVIQNNRLNWISYFERMEPESIPKQLMDCVPRATRSAGRPNLPWKDQPVL